MKVQHLHRSKMKFSAIPSSNLLHFPANFHPKIKTNFTVVLKNAYISFKTLQIRTSLSNTQVCGRLSVSTRSCADIGSEEALTLGNGRGWIHFVGIGGSGLSALAMLALKQVSFGKPYHMVGR